MSDRKAEPEFWSIWEAARLLLPSGLSAPFLAGMTGEPARRAGDAPRFQDLAALLLPGLGALGIAGELQPLPEDDSALLRALRERLRHNIDVPILGFSCIAAPPDPKAEEAQISTVPAPVSPQETVPGPQTEAEVWETPDGDSDRELIGQGMVEAVDGEQIVWRNGETERRQSAPTELRAAFSHLLRLRRTPAKGTRRANIRNALLRWLAFTDAYPERIPMPEAIDAPVRAQAAAFLQEIAGAQRTPYALRLGRAADRFAAGEVEAALAVVREAVFLEIRLPIVVQRALRSPHAIPLSDVERRELIYLARAGTRDMKTLAARRLQPEGAYADARHTLEQLRYDLDPWVRAAAQPLTPASEAHPDPQFGRRER